MQSRVSDPTRCVLRDYRNGGGVPRDEGLDGPRSSIGLRWIRSQKLRRKIRIKDETVRRNANERIGIDEHQRYFRASAA